MFAIDDVVFWTKGERKYYDKWHQPVGVVAEARDYTLGGTTPVQTATCKSIIDGRKYGFYADSRRKDTFEIVARKGLDKW